MNESDRYEPTPLLKAFQTATEQGIVMESALYHLGRYCDESFKQLSLPHGERYAPNPFCRCMKDEN